DWGGTIGMPLMVLEPDRIARAVILDTAIDPSQVWTSERWIEFREFVERTEDFPAGEAMRGTLYNDPGDDVIAAYDAPYVGPESNVALRALALLAERTDLTPNEAAELSEALKNVPRPFRIMWSAEDMFLPAANAEHLASSIGRQVDEWIQEAGHGLPEDQGEL